MYECYITNYWAALIHLLNQFYLMDSRELQHTLSDKNQVVHEFQKMANVGFKGMV